MELAPMTDQQIVALAGRMKLTPRESRYLKERLALGRRYFVTRARKDARVIQGSMDSEEKALLCYKAHAENRYRPSIWHVAEDGTAKVLKSHGSHES